MTMTATCADGSYDASTGTCSAIVWVDQSNGVLPVLSIDDAYAISQAMVLLWTVAYCWKVLNRFVSQS